MLRVTWCYLCNLKNEKNTPARVLLLVKLQASNCTNGTKSRNASQICMPIPFLMIANLNVHKFFIRHEHSALSVSPTKWSNTLKNCLNVFDNFLELALKGKVLPMLYRIVLKFRSWYKVNLSKLSNLCFPKNHQKNIDFLMISGGIEGN